jgi:glycosyltransferase 2 family protein
MPQGLITKLIVFVALALAVGAALVVYADADDFIEALESFSWWLVPIILVLVLVNYAFRFAKWHYYLGVVHATHGLPLLTSALIFLTGLAMVITPAKAGEFVKSYFLREANGTPIRTSAPVVLMERLTDATSIFLLSLAGLVFFSGSYWPLFALFGALLLASYGVIRVRWLARLIIRMLVRLPIVRRFDVQLDELYEACYQLLAPKPLMVVLALGFVGWGCEAVGLYLVVYGLTDMAEFEVLVKSAFIMGVASLAGGLAIVPGGLGVSETGITGLGRVLLDLSRTTAATAALLIRFFTLWFGVFVGLGALLLISRQLGKAPAEEALEAATA